jgi:hypothetical protein
VEYSSNGKRLSPFKKILSSAIKKASLRKSKNRDSGEVNKDGEDELSP